MNYLELLKSQFNNRIDFRERRLGITQLILPLYYEDGDMVDIFLEKSPNGEGKIRIGDHGMALMRLSYSYELNTDRKFEIFRRILSENQVSEENGKLFIDVEPERLYPAILQFAQALAKVANMQLYKREVIQSMFFEMLEEYIMTDLRRFNPQKSYFPLPNHEEYEVDYCFNSRPKPIFLFGVNNKAPARLSTVACQKFIIEKIPFRSVIVLESLDILGKKDQARLMAVADKQFPTLDYFKDNAATYFHRELEEVPSQ